MAQTDSRDVATDPATVQTFPRVLAGAFNDWHIALMTHVSRLQAHEQGAAQGEYLLSLVVTPAIARRQHDSQDPNVMELEDGDLPSPLALSDLLPWRLGDLTVAVAMQTGDHTAAWNPLTATVVSIPAGSGPTAGETDLLKGWLERRIAQEAARPPGRAAREILARSATSLFPHNFVLQLAVCVRVTGLPAADQTFRLAALPHFANHAGPQAGPVSPLASGPGPLIVGWDAGKESAHQIPVAAYMESVEFPAPATGQDAIYNPATQEVRLSDASGDANEQGDWLRQLPVRCGGLFDLPQRILDAVNPQDAVLDTAPVRDQLWKWILATSRDFAGTGWKTSPARTNLPLDVAQVCLGGGSSYDSQARALAGDLTSALQAFEHASMATPGAWLQFLQNDANTSAARQRVAALFQGLSLESSAATSLAEALPRWSKFLSDLRATANLRAIIARQWEAAVIAPLQGQNPTAVLAALQTVLDQTENPVGLLARGVIGDFWPAIIHVQDARPVAAIPPQARDQFVNGYVGNRNGANTDYFPPPGVGLPALTFFDVHYAASALFPNASGTALATERVPQPLVFQVGQVASAANSDPADPLRQMAGVAVFMKNLGAAGVTGARCLNLGRLVLPDLDHPDADPTPLDTLLLAPRRLGYLNGTSAAHLTYNNLSLLARSEGGRINDQSNQSVPGTGATRPPASPYFQLPALNDQIRAKVRLPALAYGRDYEASCFAVLNAGILPPVIAHPDHPAILRSIPDTGFDIPDPNATHLRVSYKRRVGIGAPSFVPVPSAAPNTTKLPAAFARQPDAAPLALELLAAQGVAPGQEPPVALLYPDRTAQRPSQVAFNLFKAATDFENWDRWVQGVGFRGMAGNVLTQMRAKARADTARQRESGNGGPSMLLDDPALEDAIYFTATPLFAEPAAAALAPQLVPVPVTDGLRGTPVSVTIIHGGTAAPTATAAAGNLTVTLPAGSVWHLRFYSVARTSILNGSAFDLDFSAAVPVAGNAGLGGVSPMEILVELAATTMPGWDDLFQALAPQTLGRQAVLDLQRPNQKFAFLSRIEADLQVWSWSGRPVDPFPFARFALKPDGTLTDPAGPDGPDLLRWDVGGFGHRQDSACRTHVTRVTWAPAAGGAGLPIRLFTENRESDARALYLRWSLRAFSRYPRLVPQPVTTPAHSAERWRRVLLPAALGNKLQKPSLKLVLPLGTRLPDRDGVTHRAVLAVFNGAWYKEAGAAETLEVQLLAVSYQPPDGTAEQTYLQAGHDPVVSTVALPALTAANPLPALNVQPPVGHTFDGDASEPLIVGTSFNLLLPELLTGATATDGQTARPLQAPTSDWFMAALRFRRGVDPAGALGGANASASFASEWTAPEWVQFAPAHGDLLSQLPQAWSAAQQGSPPVPITLQFRPGTRWSVPTWFEPYSRNNGNPGNFAPGRFEYWFVLTREARDLDGRTAEAYVMTLGPTDQNTFLDRIDSAPDAGAFLGNGSLLVLRVVELRTRDRSLLRKHLGAGGNAWELLFGDAAKSNPMTAGGNPVRDDVAAQIIRVSPAVQVRADIVGPLP